MLLLSRRELKIKFSALKQLQIVRPTPPPKEEIAAPAPVEIKPEAPPITVTTPAPKPEILPTRIICGNTPNLVIHRPSGISGGKQFIIQKQISLGPNVQFQLVKSTTDGNMTLKPLSKLNLVKTGNATGLAEMSSGSSGMSGIISGIPGSSQSQPQKIVKILPSQNVKPLILKNNVLKLNVRNLQQNLSLSNTTTSANSSKCFN